MFTRLLLLCLCAVALRAADVTFIASSGTWNIPGNWSTGLLPTTGQSVDIPVGCAVAMDVDSAELASISIEGSLDMQGRVLTAVEIVNSGSVLAGGTLRGATVRGASFVWGACELDEVTIASDQGSTGNLIVRGNLTLADGVHVTVGSLIRLRKDGNGAARIQSLGTSWLIGDPYASTSIYEYESGTSMSIGSGVVLTGGGFQIMPYYADSTLVLEGTVEAVGQYDFAGIGASAGGVTEIRAGGILRVAGGGAALAGRWSNAGTLALDSGTMVLGGTFGAADVAEARWSRADSGAAGSVEIWGTLQMADGETLGWTPSMGDWRMVSGTIAGGELSSTGPKLICTDDYDNTLRDTIIDADVDLKEIDSAKLTVTGTVSLGEGRTIWVGGPAANGYLYFVGDSAGVATLKGVDPARDSAWVQFGPASNNWMMVNAADTTMTIGAGVTVLGGSGHVMSLFPGSSITVDGAVEAASPGQQVDIGYNYGVSVGAGGSLRASGGSLLVESGWTNAGTLEVEGGVLLLDGTFSSSSVAPERWWRGGAGTAGSVRITGTLTISGATLEMHPTGGDWEMAGGSIVGGTLSSTGPRLIGTTSASKLRNVVVDADIDLTGAAGTQMTVIGVVTLGDGRTVSVGGPSSYANLFFVGDGSHVATLASAGQSTVLFGAQWGNALRDNMSDTQITIDQGVTVRGGAGSLCAFYGGSSLTLRGRVSADEAGRTITIGTSDGTATNRGTVSAAGGGLSLLGSFINAGELRPGIGYPQALSGLKSFIQQSTGILAIEIGGTDPGQFDRLSATQGITMGGVLEMSLANGFLPGNGQVFNILAGGWGVGGAFSSISGPAAGLFRTARSAEAFMLYTENTAILTSPMASPVKASVIPMNITFSNAVTGFTAGDLTVTNATVGGVTGSGALFTCAITPTILTGTVSVLLPAGAVDFPGNSSALLTCFIDRLPPTIVVTPDDGETAANPIIFTIRGDEPLASIDASRISVTGALAQVQQSDISGTADPAVWTVFVVPLASGTPVELAFAVGAALDAAGNGSAAASAAVGYVIPDSPPVIGEGAAVAVAMDEDNAPTAFGLTLHATDADADILSWSVLHAASHGSVALDSMSAGAIGYAPDANYNGTDEFTIQVDDGRGGTAPCVVTVTIAPRNDAPMNEVAPAITGTPLVDGTLTAGIGTWNDAADGVTGLVYSFAWYRADDAAGLHESAVLAATPTYVLSSMDLGKFLRVAVTATDDGVGLPVTASSTASSAWVAVAVPPNADGEGDGNGCGSGAGVILLGLVGLGLLRRRRW